MEVDVPAAPPKYAINVLDRTFAILRLFETSDELGVAEVARGAALSEPTALRYLASLAHHGALERDPASGRYRLGLRLFRLGRRSLALRGVRDRALPAMERLRARFGETVNLALRNGDEVVVVEALEGTRSLKRGARVGEQDLWHSSALGKAILAFLPEEEARDLVERRGAPRLTGATRTSYAELLRDFDAIRRLGYAVDDEESEDGLRCVAAPIFDEHGRAAYALSVSGPAQRLAGSALEEAGAAVQAEADDVSAAVGGGERARWLSATDVLRAKGEST